LSDGSIIRQDQRLLAVNLISETGDAGCKRPDSCGNERRKGAIGDLFYPVKVGVKKGKGRLVYLSESAAVYENCIWRIGKTNVRLSHGLNSGAAASQLETAVPSFLKQDNNSEQNEEEIFNQSHKFFLDNHRQIGYF